MTRRTCCDCGVQISNPKAPRCQTCAGKFRSTPAPVRFWRFVNKTDTCWLWTGHLQDRGSRAGQGYGFFDGKNYAHRFSWELAHEPIPAGMCVLHKCDVKQCVNPEHLFLGSPAQNTRDMVIKGRHRNKGMLQTRCLRGHEFTHTDPVTGWRKCRTCDAMRIRIARQQKSAAAFIAHGAIAS